MRLWNRYISHASTQLFNIMLCENGSKRGHLTLLFKEKFKRPFEFHNEMSCVFNWFYSWLCLCNSFNTSVHISFYSTWYNIVVLPKYTIKPEYLSSNQSSRICWVFLISYFFECDYCVSGSCGVLVPWCDEMQGLFSSCPRFLPIPVIVFKHIYLFST